MRVIQTIILSFLVLSSFSQTIKEREKDLDAYMPGTTWKTKTNKAWELLSIDKFNKTAISYILRVYIADYKRDSISIFFENLIDQNKNSVIPYLLRIQFSRLERLNDKQRIEYLKRAYKQDSSNIQIDSLLGRLCYEEFNKHFSSNLKRNKEIDNYAKTSLICFNRLCELDKRFQVNLKYPLIQLSSYLNDSINKEKYNKYNQNFYYFPVTKFINLPPDWETNEKVDLINNSAFFELEWYSKHLAALNEPVLFSSTTNIFRFTFLPSTGHSYVIGLKNIDSKITLYWKICDNLDDSEIGKIIENRSKQLSLTEWDNFQKDIQKINFWNLPTTKVTNGLDGSTWILEGNQHGQYHVVSRWEGDEIERVCSQLLTLKQLNKTE